MCHRSRRLRRRGLAPEMSRPTPTRPRSEAPCCRPALTLAYLQSTLKLAVNLAKSKVAPMSECSFLGFTIKGKKIRWTDKALANFKHGVKELTGRSWGVSMEHRLHKLGQCVRGWTAYFGISQYYRPVPVLDDWIRRRMRMCYWKQWRWPRTKIRHLLAQGVSLKTAIQHGVSSKSYWHMARTPAVQQVLSNAEPGHKASSGRLVPGEGLGHWPNAACKAG
ncbi:MAG: hypothetical protein IPJ08_24165 [Burkholderiales bacterium]|nr:hypothetical protein [Burkholderiales bacterium]